MKKKSDLKKPAFINESRKNDFVFMKAYAVTVTRTGSLLIKINASTGISLHPNFINAVLNPNKKAA